MCLWTLLASSQFLHNIVQFHRKVKRNNRRHNIEKLSKLHSIMAMMTYEFHLIVLVSEKWIWISILTSKAFQIEFDWSKCWVNNNSWDLCTILPRIALEKQVFFLLDIGFMGLCVNQILILVLFLNNCQYLFHYSLNRIFLCASILHGWIQSKLEAKLVKKKLEDLIFDFHL